MKNELQEVHINHFKQRGIFGLYVFLRFSVFLCLILEAIQGRWNNVFLCVLTLILFLLPVILDKTFNIELPTVLEIIVLLFIYSAEILGEIQNFYGIFKNWDTILHTINGFIMAAIGFSMIDILNRSDRFHINLTPLFVALVAFCFSMTIGVLWEFFEYGMDVIVKTDMQKDRIVSTISTAMLADGNNEVVIEDIEETIITGTIDGEKKEIAIENGYLDIGIHDTIKDLIVNCIGAIIFSFIGYLYILGRNNGSFIKQFIPFVKRHKHRDKDQNEFHYGLIEENKEKDNETSSNKSNNKKGRKKKSNTNINSDANTSNNVKQVNNNKNVKKKSSKTSTKKNVNNVNENKSKNVNTNNTNTKNSTKNTNKSSNGKKTNKKGNKN